MPSALSPRASAAFCPLHLLSSVSLSSRASTASSADAGGIRLHGLARSAGARATERARGLRELRRGVTDALPERVRSAVRARIRDEQREALRRLERGPSERQRAVGPAQEIALARRAAHRAEWLRHSRERDVGERQLDHAQKEREVAQELGLSDGRKL